MYAERGKRALATDMSFRLARTIPLAAYLVARQSETG